MTHSLTGMDDSFPGMDGSFLGMDESFPGRDESFLGMDGSFPGRDESFPGMGEPFPGGNESFPGADESFLDANGADPSLLIRPFDFSFFGELDYNRGEFEIRACQPATKSAYEFKELHSQKFSSTQHRRGSGCAAGVPIRALGRWCR